MAAGGLCVLTADADAPIVAQTPVQTNALHALEILAEGLVEEIRVLLRGLA
eukprot:CAMPEP_0170260960 /NCGR_PEP_ID=MMETSP0116_2-20130129/30358_1 /TAXON_ID=400756 /ORGANISM="Durinskia baltica, Strain CSIRO CS-38" /LENGTH=50 /DNA_ID=CAMNT_0010512019 /DNA_START=71 /DNA_END=220 /DNA_ORIENTATION=+